MRERGRERENEREGEREIERERDNERCNCTKKKESTFPQRTTLSSFQAVLEVNRTRVACRPNGGLTGI